MTSIPSVTHEAEVSGWKHVEVGAGLPDGPVILLHDTTSNDIHACLSGRLRWNLERCA
jgi:hypothetical protein